MRLCALVLCGCASTGGVPSRPVAPAERAPAACSPTSVATPPTSDAPGEDAPEIYGPLELSVLRDRMRSNLIFVGRCFIEANARKPSLAGRVRIRFTIEPSGEVSSSRVQASTIGDPETERCVADAGYAFRFPRTSGLVVVSYPFALVPAP